MKEITKKDADFTWGRIPESEYSGVIKQYREQNTWAPDCDDVTQWYVMTEGEYAKYGQKWEEEGSPFSVGSVIWQGQRVHLFWENH